MNTKDIPDKIWTKIWAGNWSFLTCSHFGNQYTKEIVFNDKPFLDNTVIIIKHGKSSCWAPQEDKDRLGEYLAEKVRKEPSFATTTCNRLKTEVDRTLKYIQEQEGQDISLKDYKEYWDHVLSYYTPHITVKYIVDYLDQEHLKRLLPSFEEARVYAEPVFKRTEEFMTALAERIGKKQRCEANLVLCTRKEEFYDVLQGKALPNKEILQQRFKESALVFNTKEYKVLTSNEAKKIEDSIAKILETDTLRGSIGYKGKAQGHVHVVRDPNKATNFKEGQILVAESTRPEYVPLMNKAAAIVTDAGGILSHAAIVARELKKPCVIGTGNATKVLKDGDLVEVDADNGIVRKIK